MSFKEIVNSIISCSEEGDNLIAYIQSSLLNETINIQKMNRDISNHITLYIDLSDELYEWSCIIKVDNKFYFKLIDKYVIEII